MGIEQIKTPEQLLGWAKIEIKSKLPDLKEHEVNRIMMTVSQFCKTEESVKAFLEGYKNQ